MSKEIWKKLGRINRAVLEAKTFYEMWVVLCGEQTRPKYVGIMNKYGMFSRALITTTLYTTIIALYKVTDTRSHNLADLFKILPNDKFSKEEIKLYQEVLTKHKKTIRAVTILRNNAFGHNSINLDYKSIFKKAAFVPNECKQYIADLVSIVVVIYIKLGKPAPNFDTPAADELESIFHDLMNYAAKPG